MQHRWLGIVGAVFLVGSALLVGDVLPTRLVAQADRGSTSATATADGPYARIATLRPHDARTTVEILTLRPTMSYGIRQGYDGRAGLSPPRE